MNKWISFAALIIILFFSSLATAAEKALVLTIDGPISPAIQDYIERGIGYATKEHFSVVILQMNTPGGLDSSMRGIDSAIVNSPLPIITYVAPSGARAGSAGVFILYASHIAAMAPGTNIGAASPVSLMGTTKAADANDQSAEEKKVVNDAAAYIRSLAELRGRNANWGELAVRQAVSISASEAKKLNVIDELADNIPQLLQKIDGKKVSVQNASRALQTKNMSLENMTPDWRYQFLAFLTDPNIAYLLMLVALYGLFFELSNPGLVLPGVAGIISLLLVMYAFQLMPVNYVGLALILIGVVFMLFEVYVSSFGVIGIGGVIAFIIGSIMLFDIHDANYHISWSLIIIMSLVTATFFFLIVSLAIKSHKKSVVTGKEGLIGSTGTVLNVMNEQVVVRVLGEIWEARANEPMERDEKIKVTAVKGLILTVEPLKKNQQKLGD